MNRLCGLGISSKVREPIDDAVVLAKSGLLRPLWPDVALRGAAAVIRHGLSPATAYGYGAARYPREPALVDEKGTLTFAELSCRISSTAALLEGEGIGRGDRIGVLCRNEREFVETVGAASSLGADLVLLNVSFAAPQLADVLVGEGVTVLVYDEEFAAQAKDAAASLRRFVASGSKRAGDPPIEGPVAASRRRFAVAPRSPSRYVLLTSGTTGRPRGTTRPVPFSLSPLVALLSRIPLRARDVTLIASPMFHAWGFGQLGLSMVMSSTVVLRRRFDPESILRAVADHRVRVLVAVPFVLQRLLELPARTRRRYDISSLEVVMTSGSQLSEPLARRFMDDFGEILYNLYGSTEAAWAAIATPSDLRAGPGTVGFPPRGTKVRIVDENGLVVAPRHTGRVLVRNMFLATSYSDGEQRDLSDGYLATGDLGHADEAGRLYIDGRTDDMVVSGGENVFPQEVEDLLAAHPAISEAAVEGVEDPEYGQRLRALVVRNQGSEITEEEVRSFVREHLAGYKVPRDVVFVAAIERNEIGKLLRRRS